MASDSPLILSAYSGAFAHQQDIDGLVSATVNPLRNKVGTTVFELPSDHPTNEWLQKDDARVVATYLGRQEMSGPCRLAATELQKDGTTTYTVEDDVRIWQNTLGWVRPVASGSSQGQAAAQSLSDDAQAVSTVAHPAGTDAGYGAYVFDAQASGAASLTAEAAIKELTFRNIVQRVGRPATVMPDLGRGGNALSAGKLPVVRNVDLLSALQDLLNWSGLTLTARQGANGFLLDVRAGAVYPNKLTLDSGIITDGTGQRAKPNATRILVGGPGDDTARAYTTVVDAAAEAKYADVIEVLKDASSVNLTWASSVSAAYQVAKYYALQTNAAADIAAFQAAMLATGQEGLTDGAAKSGLSMTLAETDTFHYGGDPAKGGVLLGDVIPVQVTPAIGSAPALILTGTVSGATITLDDQGGVKAQTQVGDRTDDPDQQLADAIAGLQTALRRAAARK